MQSQDTPKTAGIQVISRAAAVLRLLGRETGGLSLGQIAAGVNLPRSTVQRIVAALAAEGFIATGEGSRRIRLGPELHQLGQALPERPIERLRAAVSALAIVTGETVDLAVLRGSEMLFVDQVEGRHRLRTVSRIGESFPLTTTANGKAALACLDPDAAEALVRSEIGSGRKARAALKVCLAEIATIRAGALAVDEDEHTEGISALGFGVRAEGAEIYALSIPVPSSRYVRVRGALIRALEEARAGLSGI